ncbi:MAG: tetratricopeptide repeat protein [Verrucomicrobiota bacterium]
METPPTKPSPPGKGMISDETLRRSSLLRQLINDRYFRFGLALVTLLVASTAILLPKGFRSTPEGFLPVIHVALLDKIQARSLSKSARSSETAGQMDAAILGWQLAVANDPGDPALSRGLVSLIARQPVPDKRHLRSGASHALWLLRLTRTNRDDLDLAARLFSLYGQDSYVASLLRPIETNLTPVQAREYLKSQFHLGYMDAFGTTWDRYRKDVENAPDMPLYRAAWEAGWGLAETLHPGAGRLAEGRRNPTTTVLANRLTLSVAFSRADIHGYEQSLAAIVDRHADRVSDHLNHWRLLVNAGQRERAAELAQRYSNPPDSPSDALQMTDLYLELGLTSFAADFLEKQVARFDFNPEIWQRQADLLIQLKRWDDLRALAIGLRAMERISPDLNSYAWMLQGIAELQVGKTGPAETAFARCVDFPPNNPLTSYRMAQLLNRHGQHTHATALLRKLEKEFGGLAQYWFQVVSAAYQARQFEVMRQAAAKGYELATNNPIFINNYAAALLIERTNAPLAIELTLRQLGKDPNSRAAQINHALALLQNGRLDDAAEQLDRIDRRGLESSYRTQLQLGYFELNARRGNAPAALAAYQEIEPRFLMPPQARWVEETQKRLTPKG